MLLVSQARLSHGMESLACETSSKRRPDGRQLGVPSVRMVCCVVEANLPRKNNERNGICQSKQDDRLLRTHREHVLTKEA